MNNTTNTQMNTQIDLKDYRQPMVTSLGVMLGFLIGFLGQWTTEDTFSLNTPSEQIVFIGSFIGILCLLIALFRMLSPITQNTQALHHYTLTLKIYITGIIIALSAMLTSAFI